MIKRILVGLGDLEYAASATQRAVELAKACQAELTAMAVLDVAGLCDVGAVPVGGGGAAAELRTHRLEEARIVVEQVIHEFESACAAASIEFRTRCEGGGPIDRLIECARYHDLMVFGLSSLFEHGVVDEPPDELVRLVESGVRPILAVPPEHKPIERVLLAYSGSMKSARTMRRFIQFRLWPEATLQIVTCGMPAKKAAPLLADASDYCQAHGYCPETEHLMGPSHSELLRHANDWGADLIVLGNSAKSRLRRRVLGETARKIVREADRSLFLSP